LKAENGALHLLNSDIKAAYDSFQQLLDSSEQNCRIPFAWYAIALMYLKTNCLEAARASLKVVLHLDPNFESKDDVSFRLALLSQHFGDYEDARQACPY
jgi:tetratricopeptide (TPR) repeat protein